MRLSAALVRLFGLTTFAQAKDPQSRYNWTHFLGSKGWV